MRPRHGISAVTAGGNTVACLQKTLPAAKIASVVFRTKGQEAAKARPGDAEVRTPGGRLTLKIDKLTAEALVGESPALGKVTLRRDAVREIRFGGVQDKAGK